MSALRSILMGCLLALWCAAPARAEALIAAAANLQGALEAIADAYLAKTGQAVRISYGATGNLERQIRQGAPFEVFLAADEASVLALARDGMAGDSGVVFAVGRLALLVPKGGTITADATLTGLRAALGARQVTRFAIANPDHAPYGARAREALMSAGLWEALQPFLVVGESVAQAAQFAASGNADGAIVALSIAASPAVSQTTDYAILPQEWHQPLTQRMVLLPKASADARAFFEFVQSPQAQALLQERGYGSPLSEGE